MISKLPIKEIKEKFWNVRTSEFPVYYYNGKTISIRYWSGDILSLIEDKSNMIFFFLNAEGGVEWCNPIGEVFYRIGLCEPSEYDKLKIKDDFVRPICNEYYLLING